MALSSVGLVVFWRIFWVTNWLFWATIGALFFYDFFCVRQGSGKPDASHGGAM
jgi:hypothetical protein